MSPRLELEFVSSASSEDQLAPSPVELAVVGRSNVGKSSLINALANRKQLARVSNTPGRTQLINVFATPSGATFVDLPGYGYAKASKATRATWPRMIEGYLLEREELDRVHHDEIPRSTMRAASAMPPRFPKQPVQPNLVAPPAMPGKSSSLAGESFSSLG